MYLDSKFSAFREFSDKRARGQDPCTLALKTSQNWMYRRLTGRVIIVIVTSRAEHFILSGARSAQVTLTHSLCILRAFRTVFRSEFSCTFFRSKMRNFAVIWPSFRDEVFSQDRGDIWRQFFFVQLDGSWESVLNDTALTNLFLHRASLAFISQGGHSGYKTSQFLCHAVETLLPGWEPVHD